MTASTGQQFYVIEDDWVSSQIVLTHSSNQLKELTASITIEECWISDKISTARCTEAGFDGPEAYLQLEGLIFHSSARKRPLKLIFREI